MDQCVMVSVKCTNQGTIVHLTQAPDFLHWPSSKLRPSEVHEKKSEGDIL